MGLLGDLYSTIDSKKRQLRGLLSDPLETIYQGVRNIGNDWNGLLDTQAQAYPFIPRTQDQQARIQAMARTPEQARKELADQGANMGVAAATVWHGSPHKFDKFDSSKIGTGEGAQAYGHGLYLAESDDVARSYQQSTQRPEFLVNGEKWAMDQGGVVRSPQGKTTATLPLDQYNAIFGLTGSKANKPLSELAEEAESFLQTRSGMTPAKIAAAKKAILDGKIKLNAETGSLYKVDLPDEHIAKMLDWDKPLSEQPQIRGMIQKDLEDILSTDRNEMPWTYGKKADDMTGEDLVRSFASIRGAYAGASDLLKEGGIPGIRYLDGGSRGAGAGTSNYVVFPGNEDILKILERNGQPLGLLD